MRLIKFQKKKVSKQPQLKCDWMWTIVTFGMAIGSSYGASASDWEFRQIRDNFTDKTSNVAVKSYSVPGNKVIEADVSCGEWPGVSLFNFILQRNGMLGFSASGEAYETSHSTDMNGGNPGPDEVAIRYRFDSGKVQGAASRAKFINHAELFLETAKVLKAELLRVQLPSVTGDKIDVSVELKELKELLSKCPKDPASEQSHAEVHNEPFQTPPKEGQMNVVDDATGRAFTVDMATGKEVSEQSPGKPPAPSKFTVNCKKTRQPVINVLICADSRLQDTSSKLNTTYEQLRASVDPTSAAMLEDNQTQWVNARLENCGWNSGKQIGDEESARLIGCLQELYTTRLNLLQSQLHGASPSSP